MQLFKMVDDNFEENEGVLLNKIKLKDDLMVENEDQKNKGKFNNKYDDLMR